MKPAIVLLLEENKDELLAATHVLSKEKVFNMVYGFCDHQKAMQFLSSEPVDVVMANMELGGISGLDFIAQARSQGLLKNKTAIIISDIKDPDFVARADLLGVAAWIDKPLNLQKLHYMVMHVPELYVSVMTQEQNHHSAECRG